MASLDAGTNRKILAESSHEKLTAARFLLLYLACVGFAIGRAFVGRFRHFPRRPHCY